MLVPIVALRLIPTIIVSVVFLLDDGPLDHRYRSSRSVAAAPGIPGLFAACSARYRRADRGRTQ